MSTSALYCVSCQHLQSSGSTKQQQKNLVQKIGSFCLKKLILCWADFHIIMELKKKWDLVVNSEEETVKAEVSEVIYPTYTKFEFTVS